jgi:cytosine/adenosine deaminase-related metal-dependent hydrolase
MEMDWEAIEAEGLRYRSFREFFQFDNHSPSVDAMRELAHYSTAPHAPYTASLEIARACRGIADSKMLPMSVHLAEIPAEIDFFRDGRNEEVETLLRRANAWDADWEAPGVSPIRHYADNGLLNRATYAIHVNYPQDGDIDILADLKPTVVFCPATHAFFRHTEHPIERYIAAGIPLALGTDSLASNSRLSPLREAALVREKYPRVSASDVFAGITLNALKPLGWDRSLATLEPGRLADFACYQLDGDPGEGLRGEELFDALFDAVVESGSSCLTVINGRPVHDRVAVEV